MFICSICEENREVISRAIEEACKILGAFCKGTNPALVTICENCGSCEKEFSFRTESPGETTFFYKITINQKGEFSINLENRDVLKYDCALALDVINTIKDDFLKNKLDYYNIKCVCQLS